MLSIGLEALRTELHFRTLIDRSFRQRSAAHINAVLAGTDKPNAELLAALRLKELPDGSYELLLE